MINAIQKGGDATFSFEEIDNMIQESTKLFKKLKILVDEEISKFNKGSKLEKKPKKEKKEKE